MRADDPPSIRRHLSSVLAVALLACGSAGCGRPSDPIAAARRALEGCERSQTPRGVRFGCLGLDAEVEEYEGLTPIELVDVYGTELKKLGGGYASVPFAMDVEGILWEGFRFAAPRSTHLFSRQRVKLIATARLGDGAARIASCATFQWTTRSRCEGVAELLATTGPGPWKIAPGTPTFLGRTIAVPPGCELRAGTANRLELRCGEEAALTSMILGSRDDMASTVDVMREVLHRGGNLVADGEPRPCRIGGAETRCRVVSMGSGAGRVVSVLGAAIAGGAPVFAMCSQPAATAGVHPVCEGVIDFSLKEPQP